MRIGSLLLLMLSTIHCFSVEIYTQNNPKEFGRTSMRTEITKRSLDSFHDSPVLQASQGGILTAVVLDKEIAEFLMEQSSKGPLKGEGFTVTLKNNLFHIIDNRYGLECTFSLESPDKQVQQVVSDYYGEDKYWKGAVLERYLNNYVIRIWSGDSSLGHESGSLHFYEALMLATLLGDEYQWLWGIRDGEAYLFKLLGEWYAYNEELLKKQGLRLPYPNDGTAIPGFLDPNNVFVPLEEKIPDMNQ